MRDPRITKVAKDAAAHFDGVKGFDNPNRLNVYSCVKVSHHRMVTIDREPGVTPFTTGCPFCRAAGTEGDGFYRHPEMRSGMYRVRPDAVPSHEWYRPDTLDGLTPGAADHVLNGGLLLRRIDGREDGPE